MSFYERIFENSGLIREHTKEENGIIYIYSETVFWQYYSPTSSPTHRICMLLQAY